MDLRGIVIRLCLCVMLVLSGLSASAQLKLVPRRVLDSLAHPVLAADSLAFEFSPSCIDAGVLVSSAEPVRFEFRFRNAADHPVSILKVSTDCSCLKAFSDKSAVLPGKYGTVSADYYTENHFGKFERRIFVYSSSSAGRPSAVLYIRASVTDENESEKEK